VVFLVPATTPCHPLASFSSLSLLALMIDGRKKSENWRFLLQENELDREPCSHTTGPGKEIEGHALPNKEVLHGSGHLGHLFNGLKGFSLLHEPGHPAQHLFDWRFPQLLAEKKRWRRTHWQFNWRKISSTNGFPARTPWRCVRQRERERERERERQEV